MLHTSILVPVNHALCAYRNSHVRKHITEGNKLWGRYTLGLANNSSNWQHSLAAQTTCFEH